MEQKLSVHEIDDDEKGREERDKEGTVEERGLGLCNRQGDTTASFEIATMNDRGWT